MAKKRAAVKRTAKKRTARKAPKKIAKKVAKRASKKTPAKKQKVKKQRATMARKAADSCSSHCCVVGDVNGHYAWLERCPTECKCPIADMIGDPVPMSGVVCSAICGDKTIKPSLRTLAWPEILQILSKHFDDRIDGICATPR